MDEKTRDVLNRAVHTFWQAFISSALTLACAHAANVNDLDTFKTAAAAVICGALAAAFSAVKTAAVNFGADGSEEDDV